MSHIIKTTGEEIEVSPQNGEVFTLEELQGFVGGYIEMIPAGRHHVMVVNEEGKLKGLPSNPRATAIARENCVYGEIVGDVVIVNDYEID